MYLKREDYYKLKKAISLLDSLNKDDLSIEDINTIECANDVISVLNEHYKEKETHTRTKPFVVEEKYIKYLDDVREEVIRLENIINSIKDKKWKKAYDYMSNMCTRGKLKTRPTKENGYIYEIKDGFFNNKPLKQEYVDIIDERREEIVKYEDSLHKIKGSDEWKKCRSYFNLCKKRGLLEYAPVKANGYTFKVKDFSSDN